MRGKSFGAVEPGQPPSEQGPVRPGDHTPALRGLDTKWVDDRRMTIARHGERPYSITPHANKASALPG